ncbi:MAG: M48 family metalloprotease, partial [Planctomycetota bacterium]
MTNRLSLPLGLALLLVVAACTSVPYTGRRQLRLIGPEEEARMGLEAWREVLGKATVVRGTPEAEMVETVGRRIAAATGERYAWEFALLEGDDTVNAFCLPGGKVAVYTGLLPVTQTPDGLAAVLGHEVAHAVAHHWAERVSQELIAKGVMSAAGASL